MIIGISGGTGSGKTTVANRILESVSASEVVFIQQDSYYRNIKDLPLDLRQVANFDHPDALDNDLLVQHVRKLKAGDFVLLDGDIVITAGLPTHQRIQDYVDAGKPLPMDLTGGTLFHLGSYSQEKDGAFEVLYMNPTTSPDIRNPPTKECVNPRWCAKPNAGPPNALKTSRSGASAASVMVAVASAVLRLNPARPRQAPVRKCVIGSKAVVKTKIEFMRIHWCTFSRQPSKELVVP